MSLTASEMKQLEADARSMGANDCRGYLADARQCLRDTGDPIAALELLRAMWGTSHATRPNQKAALDDAGGWLEARLDRDPGITPERLDLELGWVARLVAIHRDGVSAAHRGERDDRAPPRGQPRAPSFGALIEQLRRRRRTALDRREPAHLLPPREAASGPTATPSVPRLEHLPARFEVRFVSLQDALDAFKTARKRLKEKKPAKDRILHVQPVAADLQTLGADLACSMCETTGMEELQARTTADSGKVPSFWIAVADLVVRDGRRVAQQIWFDAL